MIGLWFLNFAVLPATDRQPLDMLTLLGFVPVGLTVIVVLRDVVIVSGALDFTMRPLTGSTIVS